VTTISAPPVVLMPFAVPVAMVVATPFIQDIFQGFRL
jgi:hypothetical protein